MHAAEMIGKTGKKFGKERNERLKGIQGIPSRFSKTQPSPRPLVLELARDSGRSPAGNDPPSKLASTLLRITRHMSPLSPRRIPDDFSRLSRANGVDQFTMRDSPAALCSFPNAYRRKIVCRTNGTWSGYLGGTARPLYQYEGKSRAKPGLYPKDVRKKDPMASSHNLEVLDR